MADNNNAVGLAEPAGGAGTCHVVSMVSRMGDWIGAADKLPEVVHQVTPESVPMVILQVAASVAPQSGAGSEMLNLSPRASPS